LVAPTARQSRTQDERVDIRRSDRAVLDDAAIAAMLREGQVAFVATCSGDQPYVLPNLYWFNSDRHTLYFHTATEGRTRMNVEDNPKVSASVATMGKLLPAEKAYDFSVEYSSVCVFGEARIVEDEEEARYALQGLLDKYFPDHIPGENYRPITRDEITRTTVFAIEIESWSGKRKVADS
jgi:nitroimidazol reductase NimA-like FMN-containing flavoprotein (pyridoxamine 5'-phosphate oxidase superfamily)